MSQKDDSEDGIWQYKCVVKRKNTQPQSAVGTKRKCNSRKPPRRDTAASITRTTKQTKGTKNVTNAGKNGEPKVNGRSKSVANGLSYSESPSSSQETNNNSDTAEGPSSGDYCPLCQMPFSALMVHSQRWHVAECLDRPRDKCTECPDGVRCSSTVPNHYRNYNHTFLARSRASGDAAFLSLYQQGGTTGESSSSCLPELIHNNNNSNASDSQTSQDSAVRSQVSSPCNNVTKTPPSKHKNGLLFLRSPGPEDLRKKKGWSSTPKGRKSLASSQESNKEQSSTAVKDNKEGQTGESHSKASPEDDDFISYSPLSDFPAQTEVQSSECRKSLFKDSVLDVEGECSLSQVNDGFSSDDELLNEFMDSLDASNVSAEILCSNLQLDPLTSLGPTDQPAATQTQPALTLPEVAACAVTTGTTSSQSPQSVVLERLRERLHSESLHLQNSSDNIPPSQNQTSQKSSTMAPLKGKTRAAQASSLKQTDIGVFFGLKPLNKKQEEAEDTPQEPSSAAPAAHGKNQEPRRPRRGETGRERRSRKDTSAEPSSEGTAAAEKSESVNAEGGAKSGWRRRWGRRNRVNADGEVQLPRCPFYKKIPGTKFVIDAFQYGEIEGITAYFLTHFHSDHYGGLTKNSTFPIYCNKITGNLVKSKLKVAEQYVHVLPMNAEVTVDGVKVILLDANHCPGAAMLLFFLPDGQTVLHTGDFRADPSMETYSELLSCRVQTLYLDTTYCNPQYAFPRQQEVINFAANTAFESVTLNPRTLVVCGSYSVGKEKVFLALADVLGSKVCLSRDKYNTMCCLESDVVKRCITTDWKAAQVHVLPMMQLSFNKLQQHLARFSKQYDRLVAFKPTGWTFSQQLETVEDVQPAVSGNISIYGVPYSEHSSFLELKRFVQWLQPLKIIPTVNNGSWSNRKTMEEYFRDWLAEAKANT